MAAAQPMLFSRKHMGLHGAAGASEQRVRRVVQQGSSSCGCQCACCCAPHFSTGAAALHVRHATQQCQVLQVLSAQRDGMLHTCAVQDLSSSMHVPCSSALQALLSSVHAVSCSAHVVLCSRALQAPTEQHAAHAAKPSGAGADEQRAPAPHSSVLQILSALQALSSSIHATLYCTAHARRCCATGRYSAECRPCQVAMQRVQHARNTVQQGAIEQRTDHIVRCSIPARAQRASLAQRCATVCMPRRTASLYRRRSTAYTFYCVAGRCKPAKHMYVKPSSRAVPLLRRLPSMCCPGSSSPGALNNHVMASQLSHSTVKSSRAMRC